MTRRGWWLVLAAALALGLASLASDVPSQSQLSGQDDAVLAVRSTVSKCVNAGTVWAGLAVLAGWLVRRPVQAAAAGVVACLGALVAHYGAGHLVGLFGPDVWTDNAYWFAAALVLGGPLGLVGALARRRDTWGLGARLVVPVLAVLEPFATGRFASPAMMPWPGRVSSTVSGVVLLAGGAVGGAVVLFLHSRRRSPGRPRRV